MDTITLTTTATVTISELIDNDQLPVTFTHPTTNYVLSDKWLLEEMLTATSLQTAITSGNVVVQRNGVTVTTLDQLQPTPPPLMIGLTASANLAAIPSIVTFSGATGQTITLPAPATMGDGGMITIKSASVNDVTIATAGGNIDGYTTITFSGDTAASLTLVSDGTNWGAI